jgi:hypothetical protein
VAETLSDWLPPPETALDASTPPVAPAVAPLPPAKKAESLGDWLPPPEHPTTAPIVPPPTTYTYDEYGRPGTVLQPQGVKGITLPSASDVDATVRNALQPAPNTTYGDVLPLARDETTGKLRFAMPNMLRSPLLGLTTQGPVPSQGFATQGATINPSTGTFGLTPEAQSVAPFAATPLRFSGPNALQFVPPGTLDATTPLAADFTTNPMSAELAARMRGDTTAGANRLSAAPSTPTGVPTTTPPPAVSPTVRPPQTSAEAKQVASGYYDLANQSGGTLTPQFTNKFIDGVSAAAPQTEAGQAVAGSSAVTNLVSRLQTLRDQPMTLQAAQEVDEGISNLIDKEYGVKGLSKDGKNLLDIQNAFRDQIENAGPGDITGGTTGFDALSPARQAWSQAMKMSDLERMQTRANMTDNPTTSIRTQIRTLLSNPSRARGYTPDEVAALQDAGDRGLLGGALHLFGSRLVPIVAGAVEAGTGGVTAGLATAATTYMGGSAARSLQNYLAARRFGGAMSTIAQGVPPPANMLQQPMSYNPLWSP